jgi:hypothetical protein
VQKIIMIGSMGSAPHIREIYSYRRCLSFSLILPDIYSPNGNSHLDQNASIDANFLRVRPFGGLEICKENFRGQIRPEKLKRIFNHCTNMKLLNNF